MSVLAAVGAGLGLAGGAANAAASFKLQKDQQDFTKKVYRNRYQWTMGDMQEAGLNPMLAYRQGVGSASSPGGAASVPNFGQTLTGGMESGARTSTAKKQRQLLEQQTTTSAKQAELMHSQRFKEAEQAGQAAQQSLLLREQTTAQQLKNIGLLNEAKVEDQVGLGHRYWDRLLRSASQVIPFAPGGNRNDDPRRRAAAS